MNAHLPVVRPLLCYARRGATPMDQKTGARRPRRPHTQHNALSEHTSEQGPSGPRDRTHNATRRAGTPVNRGQEAQDTAHGTQHTERAHR